MPWGGAVGHLAVIGHAGSVDSVAQTRAALMARALEQGMALALRHANDSVQFGKPIGKFQAARQPLVLTSAEVAAACVATDAAGQALERGRRLAETACAKMRVGEAAGAVAALARQIHGAIGVTHGHVLHHGTRRLWNWRDEFGSKADWAGYLGHWICQRGTDGFWPGMTAPSGIPTDGWHADRRRQGPAPTRLSSFLPLEQP